MIKNIYILSLLLILAACSSNEYVGETIPNERPITLGGNAGMVTRTGSSQGLEEVLPADNKTALIYGIKNTATTWEDVFQNYVLSWQENTAGTTASNSSDWEYVGGTSMETTPVTQTIKYWDYSASMYNFFAVAPIKTGHSITGSDPTSPDLSYTVDVDPENPVYFTRVQEVYPSSYGKPVSLEFQSILSKVRVGLYETIPGYEITNLTFYAPDVKPSSARPMGQTRALTTEGNNQPILIGANADEFATAGRYTIKQNAQNSEMDIVFEVPQDQQVPRPQKNLQIASDGNYEFISNPQDIPGNIPSPTQGQNHRCPIVDFDGHGSVPVLGRTSSEAVMGVTEDGTGYIPVLSNPNKAHKLSIKCDYTLRSKSTGSEEVIEVKGQTATVPEQYGTWRPNYAYTYLFKITEAGAGLYPISFDACIETFADNGDGTVTIVQKPSITTWQYGAVHDGDVNTPERDVHYVTADNTGDNTHDVDVQVSTTGVEGIANTGRALEVCYYGPQITEGEFELLDKAAIADASIQDFVWAPIAIARDQSYGPDVQKVYSYRKNTTELATAGALWNCNERADSHLPDGVTNPHTTTATYNDGTFTFGTFRPLRGGYYAVRFTYVVDSTTYYAYKIVKIGDYFALRPTIDVDDTYQNGVVIE